MGDVPKIVIEAAKAQADLAKMKSKFKAETTGKTYDVENQLADYEAQEYIADSQLEKAMYDLSAFTARDASRTPEVQRRARTEDLGLNAVRAIEDYELPEEGVEKWNKEFIDQEMGKV